MKHRNTILVSLGLLVMTTINTYLVYFNRHTATPSSRVRLAENPSESSHHLRNSRNLLNPLSRYSDGVIHLNRYRYSKLQQSLEQSPLNEMLYVEDIFIGLKSTHRYHEQRVRLLVNSWIDVSQSSVYLITDGEDLKYSKIFGNGTRYVNTQCGTSHNKEDLLCKLQVMYDTYMSKLEQYKWFCSVDDDTYINIPNFVKMLRSYDPDKDWYIGKPSLTEKYTIKDKENNIISYWFATGGAGLCISRALAKRMQPLCSNGGFYKRGVEIKNPDDTTIGYVCNHLLKVNLTVVPTLHSHLEPMWMIDPVDYHKLISISWGEVVASKVIAMSNRLLIRKEIQHYSVSVDPTRVYSLHCHLFPTSDSCRKIIERLGPMPTVYHKGGC